MTQSSATGTDAPGGIDAGRAGLDPAGFYRFSIGGLACIALSEGDCGPTSPTMLAVDQPPAEIEGLVRARGGDPAGARINVTAMAVQRGDSAIVIDTGFGIFSTPDGANRPGRVAPNLEAAGVRPEQVELVVLTHPHGDHAGGVCLPDGGFTYPNARYVLPRQEWDFWTAPDPDLSGAAIPDGFREGMKAQARTVLPRIKDRLHLAEPDEEVAPGLTFVPTPGHTHGMVGVEIADGGESMLCLADAFMHPVISVEHPEWRVAMDLDPATSERTRRELLARLAASGEIFLSTHFPWPALGRIVVRGDGHEWVPVEWRWSS